LHLCRLFETILPSKPRICLHTGDETQCAPQTAAKIAPTLLRHRSVAVRAAAVEFIVVVAGRLSPADVYVDLLPLILPALEDGRCLSSPAPIDACNLMIEACA